MKCSVELTRRMLDEHGLGAGMPHVEDHMSKDYEDDLGAGKLVAV